LQGSLSTAYSGLGQSHKLLLLEEGMKVEKLGVPPDDSQFLESRQFQIPEVARWFNLPPHKLKDLTRSSFSNIESEQISFVTDSILPWLVRLENNYNMQLLSKSDKEYSGRGRLYYKHIVEGLLRGDSASRAAFYTAMFNLGAMSPNEIREKEDMDPYPGGDIRLVPMNMTTPANALKPPVVAKPLALREKGNGEDKTEEADKEDDATEAEDA
jgi:HK97 family phage portal protein